MLLTGSVLLCLYSQLLSAVLLLLRLWESGTREMDNERSTQGTSAPLLPLLQRFQNIHSTKEEPIPEEEPEVKKWRNVFVVSCVPLETAVISCFTVRLMSTAVIFRSSQPH